MKRDHDPPFATISSFHMKISFHLHVNENLFHYERVSTRTRFEKEAKGNSEMAYSIVLMVSIIMRKIRRIIAGTVIIVT